MTLSKLNVLNRWETFSTLAIFLFGFSVLSRKYLFNNNDYESTIFFFMLSTSILLAISSIAFYQKDNTILDRFCKSKKNILFGILAAILFVGGILIKNKAYKLSPNAAYVEVYMEPLKIMLVYIVSILFLSAKFNPISALGLCISLVGIYILIKNQ